MAAGRWPGRFVLDIAAGRHVPGAASVLSSPVLWLSSALSMAFLIPGVGSHIGWIDHGELVASACVLGVSHPTGYPLFTVLSRSVVLLTSWGDPVYMLNLFSAVCVALSAGGVSLLTVLLIGKTKRAGDAAIGGITASLLLVSAITVWQQATSYEVYGFQMLLYIGALLAVLLALRDMEEDSGTISRWWIIAGLLLGYGFANHMMTVYLIPAFAWLWWTSPKGVKVRLAGALLAPMLLGVSAYLYIVLRASAHPPLNWGDPSSIGPLIDHVSGKQYRVWMFSGTDAFAAAAKEFAAGFPANAGWAASLLSLAGIRTMWQRGRRVFWFIVIAVTFAIVYSLNYSIHDIESYFLLVHIMVAACAGIGTWWIVTKMTDRRGAVEAMKYILPVGVLVLNVLYRTAAFVSPDAESPEPFASAVLMGVEENATIVTGTWDFLYSPVLALQHVRGMRRDVRMIDLHLLRDRSWYVQDVIGWAGDGNDMLRQRAGAFLAELKKFEEGRPFAAQVIQMRWQEFLTQLLAGLGAAGPVYVDHGIVGELPRVFDYRPEGYLLRAVDSVSVGGSRRIPEYWPIGEKNDIFAASYRRFCSTAFLNHALYDRSNGDTLQARESLRQASIIDPGNPHLRLAW